MSPEMIPAESSYAAARDSAVELVARSPFERVLHFGESRWGVAILGGALAVALGVHVAIGQARILLPARVSLPAFYKTSEYVDVEIPKEEPKPEEPAPPPEPSKEAQAPEAKPDAKATQEPPPPEAAKAGNLLTAPDTPGQNDDDTPTFVTDPNGKEYGSGVVAKGGTADVGKAGAAASGVPRGTGTGVAAKGPPAPPAPTIVPAADLSRRPALPGANPCSGYFPSDADDNEATVTVSVIVGPDGKVGSVSLVSEDPRGQGFGTAAKRCMSAAHLTPGLDKAGNAVMTSTSFRIHFTR